MKTPSPLPAASLAAALVLVGCTTSGSPTNRPDAVTGAVQQPFKDLNLVREQTPPVLEAAAKAPYVEMQPLDCAAVRAELAALDHELGPDFDAAENRNDAILAGALRSAMGLPFRGVVRKITGAQKRDERREHAILAGIARRGFLKGVDRKSCNAPPSVQAAETPVAEPVSTPPLIPDGPVAPPP
jgi:hypothetical protein